MHGQSGDRCGSWRRSRLRRATLAVTAAGVALLAASCGGGRPAAAPSASPGQLTAQKVDEFALCVRDHGMAGFYMSQTTGSAPSYPTLTIAGWHSSPITPSPGMQSALKACGHLIPSHNNPTETSAQLRAAVKAAECMHTRGFNDFPDPTEQDGLFTRPALPASIDTSSPQFQSALKACNASP
jgi:hypothetical protein